MLSFFQGRVPWTPIIFMICVSVILLISIILILYFEKLCCFARYRFLKHFLRRITRTKRTQTVGVAIQSIVDTPLTNPDELKLSDSDIIEYHYFAGQREALTAFQATSSIFPSESGMLIFY